MYQIMKNGKKAAVTGKPVWVRLQENGVFAPCDEPNAHGIAVDGTVYHVVGRPPIEGKETVVVTEIPEEQIRADVDYLAALAGVEL